MKERENEEFTNEIAQFQEIIKKKKKTRLITMRSKPDYVEADLLLLLLMMLLWFLLL